MCIGEGSVCGRGGETIGVVEKCVCVCMYGMRFAVWGRERVCVRVEECVGGVKSTCEG